MSPEITLFREQMMTPRAAAIAGIIFSLLMIAGQLPIRTSISTISLGPATNAVSHSNAISLALDLMPFAGIAFLWFIAVVRDRLGMSEDRFFTTWVYGQNEAWNIPLPVCPNCDPEFLTQTQPTARSASASPSGPTLKN